MQAFTYDCTPHFVHLYLFTGKERDTESGNDYFGARYYASTVGRFMNPDWSARVEPVPYSKLDDPQSLNLYAYVGNNPLGAVDENGHAPSAPVEDGSMDAWLRANGNGAMANAVAGIEPVAQQQTDNKPVGSTTVGSLEKTMTHEDGSLSTQKGGDPTELEKGKTALANAIINGAESKHPPLVATPTVPASSQDAQIMRDAYTNRANGGADPVNGRTFYGTSHTPPDQLHSRPIGNGRQTVYEHFGPFNDSVGGGRQTYIYIYNDPGH
jgi:RHS repeat-associated protein